MPSSIRPFRVTRNETVAQGTALLALAPDDGEPMFAFVAGQFVMLHVTVPDGSVGKRSYSVASAPSTSVSSFEVAVKGVGETSRLIVGSKIGDVLGVQGPFGKFTLEPSDVPLVLIAGGIGITPIRSMLLDLASKGFSRDAWLFYSSRSVDDMPFGDEFRALSAAHPSFRFVPILTRETSDGWDGETGHLDAGMLKRHVPDLSSCRYYACGPTDLVDAAKTMLDDVGIDPNASFRQEIFG